MPPHELSEIALPIVVADDVEDMAADEAGRGAERPFDHPRRVPDVQEGPPRIGGEDLNRVAEHRSAGHVVDQQVETHLGR
jgi:hypothetical protein